MASDAAKTPAASGALGTVEARIIPRGMNSARPRNHYMMGQHLRRLVEIVNDMKEPRLLLLGMNDAVRDYKPARGQRKTFRCRDGHHVRRF